MNFIPARLLALIGLLLLAAPVARGQGLYKWSNLAGSTAGPGYADGTRLAARFSDPSSTAVDADGNVYVADRLNSTIRKISSTGVVTTLAGAAGHVGSDDGVGSAARFNRPFGVAVDGSGNVYVSDTWNNSIRKITGAGVVSTLVGGAGNAATFAGPSGVAVDGVGNVYVADTGYHTIRKITSDGQVSTLAGDGTPGSADGLGTAAQFHDPVGVAVDDSGNVYVADQGNQTIRKITSGGQVSTLAGSAGMMGYDNGTGSAARFWYPTGVAVDGSGTLFVTHATGVRRITSDGVVTTFAGYLSSVGTGNGTGTEALFDSPAGLSVDGAGNLFVADPYNHAIRKVTGAQVVTTFAGTLGAVRIEGRVDGAGSAARFAEPHGIAVDGSGNVYVADAYYGYIRKVTKAGVVTTVAGTGRTGSADGAGSAAEFNYPENVAVDGTGNLYVTDAGNHTIRKITSAGVVSTLAGLAGSSGSADGTGSEARFDGPYGVAVDGGGNLYVADSGNFTVRKITSDGVVSTLAGSAGNSGYVDAAGSAARFDSMRGVAVDGGGTVYVADYPNRVIRKITTAGQVSTLEVTDVLDPATGRLGIDFPLGVAVDGDGSVYVADQSHRICKITSAGVLSVLGGAPDVEGNEPGLGIASRFDYPGGLALAANGWLYVAGGWSNNVFLGIPDPVATVEEPAGAGLADGASTVNWDVLPVGGPGSARIFTVRNDGANDLTGLAVTIDGVPAGNAVGDFVVTTPLGATSLAAGASTTVTVTFTPSAAGPRTATLHLASNDPDEPSFTVALRGSGADPEAPDTIIRLGPAAFTNSTSTLFQFTTASGGVGVAFEGKLDAGAYAPVTNPLSLSGLAPGAHTFSVRALSPAGYPGLNPTTRSWTIDLVAPVFTSAANDWGLWIKDATHPLTLVLREGQTVGNRTIATLTTFAVGDGSPGQGRGWLTQAASGPRVLALATFTGTDKAQAVLGAGLSGGVGVLAQNNPSSTLPNIAGASFAKYGFPAINMEGKSAFLASLLVKPGGPATAANARGVFVDYGNPTYTKIARVTEPDPTTGLTFSVLKDPVLAEDDAIAFPATVKATATVKGSATTTLWWKKIFGPLQLLAQGGPRPVARPIPGLPIEAQWTSFPSLAIAADRGPLFSATLLAGKGGVTAANANGVWAADYAGATQLLFRTGIPDAIIAGKTLKSFTLLKTAVGSVGVTRSFNNVGQVVWLATFTDRTTALVRTDIP